MKEKKGERRGWGEGRERVKTAMPKPSPPLLMCFALHSEDSKPRAPYSLSPICHRLSDISKASHGTRME